MTDQEKIKDTQLIASKDCNNIEINKKPGACETRNGQTDINKITKMGFDSSKSFSSKEGKRAYFFRPGTACGQLIKKE